MDSGAKPHRTPDATNGRCTYGPYHASLSNEICEWLALRFGFPGYDLKRRTQARTVGTPCVLSDILVHVDGAMEMSNPPRMVATFTPVCSSV